LAGVSEGYFSVEEDLDMIVWSLVANEGFSVLTVVVVFTFYSS